MHGLSYTVIRPLRTNVCHSYLCEGNTVIDYYTDNSIGWLAWIGLPFIWSCNDLRHNLTYINYAGSFYWWAIRSISLLQECVLWWVLPTEYRQGSLIMGLAFHNLCSDSRCGVTGGGMGGFGAEYVGWIWRPMKCNYKYLVDSQAGNIHKPVVTYLRDQDSIIWRVWFFIWYFCYYIWWDRESLITLGETLIVIRFRGVLVTSI